MPPSLALGFWFVGLLVIIGYERARGSTASAALWIPVVWLFIGVTRLPSQWIGFQPQGIAAQAMEEGSALDRGVYVVLILLAVTVLISRRYRWSDFFRQHVALTLFLGVALLSSVWSDFPLVALKRWIRDFGTYLILLIVLSEHQPLEAFRAVLRRLFFLFIPLSIVLYKYYPATGRQYDVWSGQVSYVGAATSKNMLGLLCFVSALFFVWDTLAHWRRRGEPGWRGTVLSNSVFIAMTLWLLTLASSATSTACLLLGIAVLAAAHSHTRIRPSALALKLLIPAGICVLGVLSLGLGYNLGADLAPALGRDATLTGRTEIWETLLGMQSSPLLGAGYESFWLGSRLQQVWQSGIGTINQAHNGYLQVYLNLGGLGLVLLLGVLVAAYRTIWRSMETRPSGSSLALAIWTVLVIYNLTEAAFLGGLLWTMMLILTGSLSSGLVEQRSGKPLPAADRKRVVNTSEFVPARGPGSVVRPHSVWRKNQIRKPHNDNVRVAGQRDELFWPRKAGL